MNMRYQVGKSYPFIALAFKYPNGNEGHIGRGVSMYYPWEGEQLSFNVLELQCEEHHKVPNQYDTANKLECDGFIFRSKRNPSLVWRNQYPRAEYGQISTHGDWNVRTADPDTKGNLLFMRDAARYLEEVLEGVSHFKDNPIRCVALRKHFQFVVKHLANMGFVVTSKQCVFEGKILEGLHDVTIERLPQNV